MTDAIPVIDIGNYLAGRPGALQATARQIGDALTQVGFFMLIGHDVPLLAIERTFAEARRFHAMPMAKKLALKLNEHNNGYMVMGRYAVRTSNLNNNDKGDLNEAFFVKRERPADDPLLLSGRRFVGPNLWPDGISTTRRQGTRSRKNKPSPLFQFFGPVLTARSAERPPARSARR